MITKTKELSSNKDELSACLHLGNSVNSMTCRYSLRVLVFVPRILSTDRIIIFIIKPYTEDTVHIMYLYIVISMRECLNSKNANVAGLLLLE